MLEARDLAGRRGDAYLFAGLSFALPRGQVLLVHGPNGTGKTTLLRMLAGLASIESGTLLLDDRPVWALAPALREAVLFAGHLPALKDDLSAAENLAYLATLAGMKVEPAALARALERAGLAQRSGLPARALSAGQRRRVGLARLALVRRRLWVLDEPLTALDEAAAAWIAQLLAEHLAGGGAAVIATHQPVAIDAHRSMTLTLEPAQ